MTIQYPRIFSQRILGAVPKELFIVFNCATMMASKTFKIILDSKKLFIKN